MACLLCWLLWPPQRWRIYSQQPFWSFSAFDSCWHTGWRPFEPSKCSRVYQVLQDRPFPKGLLRLSWLWLRPSKSWGFLGNYLHLRGPGPGPLSLYQDGIPISRSKLSAFLITTPYLQSAGVPGNFPSRNFRIGAATIATSRGIPDHFIKTIGRWSGEAYLLYVRTPVDTILSVAGRLA